MKINYDRMEQILKREKRKMDAMTDKEYNEYIEQLLEEFHDEQQ